MITISPVTFIVPYSLDVWEKNSVCESDNPIFFTTNKDICIEIYKSQNKIEIKEGEPINCLIWEEFPQASRLIERDREMNC